MNWLDSIPSALLQKDLDGLWARQQAISDNMANIETPGYKEKNVSFENQLENAVQGKEDTEADTIDRIGKVQPFTAENSDQTYRADGNGVDLEQQMIEMSRTSLNYSYSLQTMSDYFSRLKTAITGSGR
jgi:flagellar basal-body rod protein FlgB